MKDFEHLVGIPYEKTSGPLSVAELQTVQVPDTANCQRIHQIFAFHVQGVALHPEQALSMEGFLGTGTHVAENDTTTDRFYAVLQPNDTVYAVKKRKNGDVIFDYSPKALKDLHVAIALSGETIFHGNKRDNASTMWAYDEFTKLYHPLRARRLI